MTRRASLPIRLLPLLALFALAPRPTFAQGPTPSEAATTYIAYERVETGTDYDLSESATRRQRARRLRIIGLTLVTASVVMAGTMALIGTADDSCTRSDEFVCIDGPVVWGAMGATFAAPVLVTGAALTTSGFVIERRERNRSRAHVSVGASRLTLTF